MSGTSLDAVDMAIVETDGERIDGLGPAGERKLPSALRNQCLAATRMALEWPGGRLPAEFGETAGAIARFQAEAALDFLAAQGIRPETIEAVGFHGQTVLHRRPGPGRTGLSVQLGDADALAALTGLPVVHDLRRADMEAGGHGAPLAPVFHEALVRHSGLETPIAVLNLGGVANVTLVDGAGRLSALDTGPANGPVDQLAEREGLGRMDEGGRMAAAGKVDEGRLAAWMLHPFFAMAGPKSLDRNEFTHDMVTGMDAADGAATLVAFAAEAVAHAIRSSAVQPLRVVACGGGRHNPEMMRALRERVAPPVVTAEEVGWRGDAIEAQAWAFLAARHLRGMPISFPETTGAPLPIHGGRRADPPEIRAA